MDRFVAMQVFCEVADRGSLSAAATSLAMSRAMASRYLESIERWLGVRLLHRSTRRVSLTEAGTEALIRCRQVLELTQDVQTVASQRRSEPSGRLRITASASFAQSQLVAAIAQFQHRFPLTEVELVVSEQALNLVEERIDLAVRIGNRLDPGLVARPLSVCRSVVCASPGYLAAHRAPRTPDELGKHRYVGHANVGREEIRLGGNGQDLRVPLSAALHANDAAVVLQGVLAGAGIGLLPTYLASEHLARGALVELLPEYEPEVLGIHAAYLSRRHQTHLLRTMVDFLAEYFSLDDPEWDRALGRAPLMRRAVPQGLVA